MDTAYINRRNKIHPWKFALWIGCGSITMMFAAWTSAYVVRHASGNWLEFKMPSMFFASTVIIILSSILLHISYMSFKKGNELLYKVGLVFTAILGFVFIVSQYMGWQQLKSIGVPLTLNPSGDFLYVLTGFHAAHVLGGIAVLTVALFHAFGLKYNPTPKRLLRFELTTTYWHFVGLLWIYLLFFVLSQS
jgi:cytochrome c oxidase subunit III